MLDLLDPKGLDPKGLADVSGPEKTKELPFYAILAIASPCSLLLHEVILSLKSFGKTVDFQFYITSMARKSMKDS